MIELKIENSEVLKQSKVVLIKTYTFESGLWYLAKSLGDTLIKEGKTVIYIPKSRYTLEGSTFNRSYQEPENAGEFERDCILKFNPNKSIDSQVLNAVVKYSADCIISFETLMEKSVWISTVKNKTGVKVIDIPMVEWVTPRFLEGGSYKIFDEIWCLTDVCLEQFSAYKNSRKVGWDFVNRELFYPDIRGIFDTISVKFYHAASLNPNHSTKNTEEVLKAFDLFIKKDNPDIELWLTGKIDSRESRKILEKHTNIKVINEVLKRDEIGNLYRNTDCVVAPSQREGLGLSFFESLACGCDLITTDYPPMNSHETPYLCSISGIKRDRGLIPLAIVDAKSIYEQLKRVYTKYKKEE